MEKKDATHRIELIVKFDPEVIEKDKIEKIILARQNCHEFIEYEFRKDNLVRIFVYIFSAGHWDAGSVELYINGLLANMTFPDGVRKSDVTVKVKELN